VLEAQRTVGRFEILQEIGRGGMAVVYLARQTDLGRQVALKELGSFHAADQAFAERFVLESRVVGSLNHPNVVTAYDYFEHEGTPYIAMEYVEGGALRPWMGKLSLAQVAGVFEGVLAGLAHAAKRGVVHRDLKPENLMVTADGTIKIADFGIAKALNQATVGRLLTATGTTVGTPTYMAPEQAMGRDVGPWTDLYSVGVIAYEMLVGRVPFHDVDTPMAILMSHVNEPIPAPRSVRPDLDPELAAWIERVLAKKPEDRIQGAHRAWDELEEIVIRILGPRWRREARLIEPIAPGAVTDDQPLTPAPFDPESDEAIQTFVQAQTPPSVEPTLPPEQPAPGPETSFRWPTAERPPRKALAIAVGGALALVSLLAGGLAFAFAAGGDGEAAPPLPTVTVTTQTEPDDEPPPPPPPPGPLARSTSVQVTPGSVLAKIRFARARLGPASFAVTDRSLSDGSARVLVAQRGIESAIGSNALAGLELRPRTARNRLTVALSATRGAFTTVEARRSANGRTLLIVATKKPVPPVDGGTDVDGGDVGGGGGTTGGGGTAGGGGGGGGSGCGRHRNCP
jgi:serine/threonine protein kinase